MEQIEVRVPGPTPLPPEVRAALSTPMVSHRSQAFRGLLHRLDQTIRPLLGTEQQVLLLTTSGTGGLEAAVVNMVEPGDHVLSLSTGFFGERFASIAARYGATVDFLRSQPGCPVDPTMVAQRLSERSYRAVLVTHCETSTGVLNPIADIAAAVDRSQERPLLLLDGVSSLGAVPLDMDGLRIDVVVTASQKAWMTPPGLAMIALSERAWQRVEQCSTPRYYLDLIAARSSGIRGETPWTPGLSLMYGLEAALSLIKAEGFDEVVRRHLRLSRRVRAGLEAMDFRLLASPGYESPTVTAAYLPQGVAYESLSGLLESEHGVQVAGGVGEMKGKIIRIGHMGYIGEDNVAYLLESIAASLRQLREGAR